MSAGQPPIACKLTEPELRQRRSGLLDEVRAWVTATRALPDEPGGPGPGFELTFADGEAALPEVLELVRLESRCCPFLRFRLTVAPAGGPVVLQVTGPPRGAEILAAELLPG
jgi:hypothetical protein